MREAGLIVGRAKNVLSEDIGFPKGMTSSILILSFLICIQLTLEQHRFELQLSTYVDFSQYSTVHISSLPYDFSNIFFLLAYFKYIRHIIYKICVN